jgi:hypothetical protein
VNASPETSLIAIYLFLNLVPFTTEIYLSGGAEALRDDHYVPAQAPLTLEQMLGGS